MDNDYAPYNPEAPQEQQDAEQLEKSKINASLPIIEDVLAWFDDQITIYKSPTTIEGVNISSDPQQVKDAVLFAQSQIHAYTTKREEFVNKFRDYL